VEFLSVDKCGLNLIRKVPHCSSPRPSLHIRLSHQDVRLFHELAVLEAVEQLVGVRHPAGVQRLADVPLLAGVAVEQLVALRHAGVAAEPLAALLPLVGAAAGQLAVACRRPDDATECAGHEVLLDGRSLKVRLVELFLEDAGLLKVVGKWFVVVANVAPARFVHCLANTAIEPRASTHDAVHYHHFCIDQCLADID